MFHNKFPAPSRSLDQPELLERSVRALISHWKGLYPPGHNRTQRGAPLLHGVPYIGSNCKSGM